MNASINKKVNINLQELDWNAFNLLGVFQLQAMKEGRTDREVTAVVEDATSHDYEHLVAVLSTHCESKE